VNDSAENKQEFPERRKPQTNFVGGRDAKIRTGLQRKFTVAITLLVLTISVVFFLFFHQAAKIAVLHEFEECYMEFTKNIACNIASFGAQPDIEKVKRLFANVMQNKRLIYIEWLSVNGKALYQRTQKKNDIVPPLVLKDHTLQEARHRVRRLCRQKKIFEFIAPVTSFLRTGMSEGTSGQFVRLGVSREKTHNAYQMRSLTVIWFLILFLIFGVGLAWFLSMIIINPIQQLARAMKIVASEEEEFDESGMPCGRRFRRINDVDLNIHTQDEIGQLADEFQIMLHKLENSYQRLERIIEEKNQIVQEKSQLAESLRELNRRNEIIIKDRTREVVEKNLRLYEIFEELQFQKEELISMNEQLEKISRMKSEFLASMSHELRTPMNSIIGFAEVLKDKMFGDLNDRQEKYLSNILASARHLLQLINNILDISKVEAGKMKLVIEPYSLNRVIDEVQNTIRTLAYKKNINLELKLSRDIVMQGDASKVKQILYNLLSNAIKFTDEKGHITISTEEIAAGKCFAGGPGSDAFMVESPAVLLTIADNGIGIKPEDQNRIFVEFEQAGQTRRKKYEGTGLGLALTRKLVILHNGHIWIESVVDQGTKVYVVLPINAVIDENENLEEKDSV